MIIQMLSNTSDNLIVILRSYLGLKWFIFVRALLKEKIKTRILLLIDHGFIKQTSLAVKLTNFRKLKECPSSRIGGYHD